MKVAKIEKEKIAYCKYVLKAHEVSINTKM